jgi:hypothetical protein
MKGHERRAAGRPDYFKLAAWDALRHTWADGKKQFDTEAEARAAAVRPGRYRISKVTEGRGRTDLEPFEVT